MDREIFFETLHPRMLEASQIEKVTIVFGALQRWSRDFPTFLRLVATRVYDPDAFVMAFERLLQVDPSHIPALNALAWHYRRLGDCVTTRAYLRAIVAIAPNYAAVKRDVFRNELMAASRSTDADLRLDPAALPDALASASYRYQVALVRQNPDRTSRRDELLQELAAAAEDVVRASSDHGLEEHAPFIETWSSVLQTMLMAPSIACVGNGSSVLGAGLGRAIDAHDLVVRINFPSLHDYGRDVGTKTDLIAFAQPIADRIPTLVDREPAFRAVPLLAIHPFGRTASPNLIASAPGLRVAGLPQLLCDRLRALAYDTPTTGLMMLLVILVMCRKPVSRFGFDFYVDEANPHYFPGHDLVFLGHDVHYERFFVERVITSLTGP